MALATYKYDNFKNVQLVQTETLLSPIVWVLEKAKPQQRKSDLSTRQLVIYRILICLPVKPCIVPRGEPAILQWRPNVWVRNNVVFC